MKLLIQRVKNASVEIEDKVVGSIEKGLLCFIGIASADTEVDVDWLVHKMIALRIFADEQGLMNQSVLDVRGDILLVSQFTLIASYKKGNRPSFVTAARPEQAIPLYESFIKKAEALLGKSIATGCFGADMQVKIQNDGPVTILMDTANKE